MRVRILGGQVNGERAEFEAALRQHCASLGIPLNVAPGSARHITVVFGGQDENYASTEITRLEKLVRDEALVLPVLMRATDAPYLPEPVRGLNAFRRSDYGSAWTDGLVDEVLGMAWLRRRKRKVFISYRRHDSEAIARQLFSRFVFLGYDVFLDDVSIHRGTNFQPELKWWMNDADLLLVLLSPTFEHSQWCLEEITFASQHDIGMLVVDWPEEIYRTGTFPGIKPGTAEPVAAGLATDDQRLRLNLRDFAVSKLAGARGQAKYAESELTTAGRERIVAACTRQRTLAIRQRLDNLLLVAPTVLPANGDVRPGARFGDLKFKDARGRNCMVRVLPFRPLPETLYEADAERGANQIAACFYEECDTSDRRALALRWLANGQKGPGTVSPIDPTGPAPVNRLFVFCGGALL